MAEYINRAKVDYEFMTTRGGGDIVVGLYERILDIPAEDVVERSKLDKAIEEISNIEQLAQYTCGDIKRMCIEILKRNIGE